MESRKITSHKLHGVHFHGVHAHRPIARRAEPALPDPTPSHGESDGFNGQSFALGLLTGFVLCAALGALGLFIRRRQQRAARRRRATLTPDKFVWSEDGRRGHHIITERVLGESAPASPVTVAFPGGAEPWAQKSVTDLLSTGVPLPAAMRDERGRFTAPSSVVGSEPASPLRSPDPAFSQRALVRTTSIASGSSGTGTRTAPNRSSTLTTLTTTTTTTTTADAKAQARAEQKDRDLALRTRLRQQSVDELRIVNAHPESRRGGELPPYSREEDPDPFKA